MWRQWTVSITKLFTIYPARDADVIAMSIRQFSFLTVLAPWIERIKVNTRSAAKAVSASGPFSESRRRYVL